MRSTRLLFWLVSLLAIALIAVAVVQAVQTFQVREAEPRTGDTLGAEALDADYIPPIVRDVRETTETLRLSGTAEPDAVVLIKNGDTRVRQVPTDGTGAWVAEIGFDPAQTLRLSAEVFMDDIGINGDELVLRIPAPGAEDGLAQRALILITAPGGPSRVVQTPFGSSRAAGALQLASIDYDALGGAILAGRAAPGSRVSLLSSGRELGETDVSEDGRWFFIATDTLDTEMRKAFTLVQATPDGNAVEVSAEFAVLGPTEELRQDPDIWQVRRFLQGGGSQVTAVFAPVAVPRETENNEDTEG